MKFILILFLLFSYGVVSNMYDYGYGINDAFWRVIWAIDEGTIWAPGFSEEKFNRIKLGMNSNDVLNLLGRPLRGIEGCEKSCFWIYTMQDSPTSDFDQRWVIFDHNNKVTEIRKSFYID